MQQAPTPPSPPGGVQEPRPGDQLGDFRILSLLGQGAMGKVYEARQLSLQRRVALKVLPAEGKQGDQQAVTRFYREARAAAHLQHPSIVPVYDFGFEQGCYYYAMQYVVGRSLQDMIHTDRTRDMKRVATWILNVARALDAAHSQGVIHRDIKPANILVREEDDEALITDFGLARQQRVKSITQVGALLGTPVYMSPEQARGEKATPSVDVYALGVTLYEALAGEVPFMAPGLRELLTAITQAPPTPPSEKCPDVPTDLEAIALKAMGKTPQDRYPNAKSMADDLLRFLRGEEVGARGGTTAQRMWRQLERRPLIAGLVVLNLAVILVGMLLIAWAPRRARAEAAEGRLSVARQALGDDQAEWQEASLELQRALAARDEAPRRRADSEESGDAALTRARLTLTSVEERLLARRSGEEEGSAVGVALRAAREARALAPLEHPAHAEADALLRQLLRLRFQAARRLGEAGVAEACQRELATLEDARSSSLELKVTTEPPGAEVTLYAIQDGENGWTLSEPRKLGMAPVSVPDALVADQPYLLVLRAPQRVDVRLPLQVAHANASEGVVSRTIELPESEAIPAGFSYIAPGEFLAGGDPEAVRPLFRRAEPLWVKGFFLADREVSVAEYQAFLRSQAGAVRAALLPASGQLGLQAGDVALVGDVGNHPVAGVRYANAREYCRWRSTQTRGALTFRLPTDLEWEKAARGLARHVFPWGREFSPSAGNLHRRTPPAELSTLPGRSHPRDRSLYEVYDLGGNLSEWVDGAFGGADRFRVLRGGSWAKGPEPTRSTSREPVDPSVDFERSANRIGFRLAFD